MKKVFASLIAVLYLSVSSGVVLNVHYCMGKIAAVAVDHTSSSTCVCGMEKADNSCCHTEYKVVKVDNEHHAAAAMASISLPVVVLPSPVYYSNIFTTPTKVEIAAQANAPPLISGPDIYLANCVFRI